MNNAELGGAQEPTPPQATQAPEEEIPMYGANADIGDDFSMFRAMFWNCKSFPFSETSKMEDITAVIRTYSPSSLGLAEHNLNLAAIPWYKRPPQILKQWIGPETTTQMSYNQHAKYGGTHLWGGTSSTIFGRDISRIMDSNSDVAGLGRWSYQRLRGKNGRVVRIYSCYLPVVSTGSTTVYTQHLHFHQTQEEPDPSPINLYIRDLTTDIQRAQETGELIILGIDANMDLRESNIFTRAMEARQLYNPLLLLPQQGFGPLPPTRTPSTRVIDGLYITKGIPIEACGYIGTAALPPRSDHAALWMDLNPTALFGHKIPHFIRPKAQRLQPHLPSVVAKFQDHLFRLFVVKRLPARINKYLSEIHTLTEHQRIMQWGFIWRDILQSVQAADHHCRKLRMGAHGFSEEWSNILRQLDFWKFRINYLQQAKTSVRSMIRLAKQLHFEEYLQCTLDEALQLQAEAKRRKNIYIRQSEHQRSAFADRLIAEIAARDDLPLASVRIAQKHKEKQRLDARRIKYAGSSFGRSGLNTVLGMDPNNPEKEVEFTTQEGVESACIREMEKRFTQARYTPFLQPPLYQAAGRIGLNQFMEYILDHGTFPPGFDDRGVEPCVHRMLPFLKRPHNIQDFEWNYDAIEYAKGWKKMKTHTSASPYGITFAQAQAITQDARLQQIPARMAWIPFQYGFTPKAWEKLVAVMLEKKKNDFRTSKLRAIGLLDSLYNHNNKQLGRRMLANAEAANQVAPEQYGSRKGKECNDQSVNKVLTGDHWRIHRKVGILASTDLKSCYDRLVHPICTLCSRRWGAPLNALRSSYGALARMQYHVRTSWNDSEAYFVGSDSSPTHGVVQGNGHGPPTYAAVSTPIFEMMRAEGLGAQITTAITHDQMDYLGMSFVDDADNIAQGRTAKSVVAHMQRLLDAWSDGSRVTGGQVVPEKSHWFLADVRSLPNGSFRYARHPQERYKLFLTDDQGKRVPVQRIPLERTTKTLGVYYSPLALKEEQINTLRQICDDWANQIKVSSLPRHLVWQAYHTTLLKKLEYVLPATNLTKAECDFITRPALNACLSHSGVNRHISRNVVYGPLCIQGMAVPDLYHSQGSAKVAKILKFHADPSTPNYHFLQVSIQDQQVELGLPEDPLVVTPRSQTYLTPTWLTDTCSYMHKYGWTIDRDFPHHSPIRAQDIYLMKAFSSSALPDADLRLLSACRKYLQVLTLGDLLDPSGEIVTYNSWYGIFAGTQHSYDWPTQTRPVSTTWSLWRKTLATIFHVHSTTRRVSTSTGALNRWNLPWYFDPQSSMLFHHTPNGWFAHRPLTDSRTRTSQLYCDIMGLPANPPPHLVAATVYTTNYRIYLDGKPCNPVKPPTRLPRCRTFWDFVSQQPSSLRWFLSEEKSIHLFDILQAVRSQTIRGVSDGSFAEQLGTAAVSLWDGSTIQYFTFAIPGLPEDQSSYRSELGGIYAQLWFWVLFCQFYQLTHYHFTIGCDGESALKAVFQRRLKVHEEQRDLIAGCKTAIQRAQHLHLSFTGKHVLGHQDKNRWNLLDLDATLNRHSDEKAGIYRRKLQGTGFHPKEFKIYGDGWTLVINGERAVTNQRKKMILSTTWQALHNHMERKRTATMDLNQVAYQALEHAMNQYSKTRQRWVSKHTNRFGAVGVNMVRWGKWSDPTCPLCTEDEAPYHEWRCPSDYQKQFRQARLDDIRTWLHKYPTDPDITAVIIQRLHEWLERMDPNPLPRIHPKVRAVVDTQDAIGWGLPFTGMWHSSWVPLQQTYLNYRRTRRSGKLWLSGLIRQTLDLAFDLWDRRNRKLHEHASQLGQLKLQQKIRWHFEQPRTNYPTHVHHRFTNLHSLLQQSPDKQQAWLVALEAYTKSRPSQLDRHHRRVTRSLGQQQTLRPSPPPRSADAVRQALREYRRNPGQRRFGKT